MARRAVRASAKASALLAPRRSLLGSLLHTCIITLVSLVSLARRPAAVPPCRRLAVPAVPEERRGERGEQTARPTRALALPPAVVAVAGLQLPRYDITPVTPPPPTPQAPPPPLLSPPPLSRERGDTHTTSGGCGGAARARGPAARAPGVGGRWVVGGWRGFRLSRVRRCETTPCPTKPGLSPPRCAARPAAITRCCLPPRGIAPSTSGLEVDGRREVGLSARRGRSVRSVPARARCPSTPLHSPPRGGARLLVDRIPPITSAAALCAAVLRSAPRGVTSLLPRHFAPRSARHALLAGGGVGVGARHDRGLGLGLR